VAYANILLIPCHVTSTLVVSYTLHVERMTLAVISIVDSIIRQHLEHQIY
jgi:hypothetical protein